MSTEVEVCRLDATPDCTVARASTQKKKGKKSAPHAIGFSCSELRLTIRRGRVPEAFLKMPVSFRIAKLGFSSAENLPV